MSTPARWTLNRTPITYRENFRSEWSGPHLRVMQALIDAGIRVGGSEEWLLCEPCEQPGCHHRWKPDLRIAPLPTKEFIIRMLSQSLNARLREQVVDQLHRCFIHGRPA